MTILCPRKDSVIYRSSVIFFKSSLRFFFSFLFLERGWNQTFLWRKSSVVFPYLSLGRVQQPVTLHHFLSLPPWEWKLQLGSVRKNIQEQGTHILVFVLPVFHSHRLHKEISVELILMMDFQLEFKGFLQFDKNKNMLQSTWRHHTSRRP